MRLHNSIVMKVRQEGVQRKPALLVGISSHIYFITLSL